MHYKHVKKAHHHYSWQKFAPAFALLIVCKWHHGCHIGVYERRIFINFGTSWCGWVPILCAMSQEKDCKPKISCRLSYPQLWANILKCVFTISKNIPLHNSQETILFLYIYFIPCVSVEETPLYCPPYRILHCCELTSLVSWVLTALWRYLQWRAVQQAQASAACPNI